MAKPDAYYDTSGVRRAIRDSRHAGRWKWAMGTDLLDLVGWKTWRRQWVLLRGMSMLSALTSSRSSSRIRFAQDSWSLLVVVLEGEVKRREGGRSRIVVGQSHKVKSIVPKALATMAVGRTRHLRVTAHTSVVVSRIACRLLLRTPQGFLGESGDAGFCLPRPSC